MDKNIYWKKKRAGIDEFEMKRENTSTDGKGENVIDR